MKELQKAITQLVDEEYNRAAAKFGKKHNSSHEAYAVIKEELEEAKDEYISADIALDNFWKCTKRDNICETKQLARFIEERAIKAACEFVQVAAMAQKAIIGYEKEGATNG